MKTRKGRLEADSTGNRTAIVSGENDERNTGLGWQSIYITPFVKGSNKKPNDSRE